MSDSLGADVASHGLPPVDWEGQGKQAHYQSLRLGYAISPHRVVPGMSCRTQPCWRTFHHSILAAPVTHRARVAVPKRFQPPFQTLLRVTARPTSPSRYMSPSTRPYSPSPPLPLSFTRHQQVLVSPKPIPQQCSHRPPDPRLHRLHDFAL